MVNQKKGRWRQIRRSTGKGGAHHVRAAAVSCSKRCHRLFIFALRAFYVDGLNLMAYNLCTGADNIYKRFYTSVPGNVEFYPKHVVYSKKQHLFLVVYEFDGSVNEVNFYWENTASQAANAKKTTVKGRDAAFIGVNDTQLAVLEDDETGLAIYILPGMTPKELEEKNAEALTQSQSDDADPGSMKGPMQFMFENEVDRIFSTPLESTLMFASHGIQIGLAKLVHGYRLSADGHYIPTTNEGRKHIKLKVNEVVLQVHWQETLRGHVAGILTTLRVLIASADLEILASSSTKLDKGLPPFRSLLWLGPALLFSTSTAVSVLGWDGKVRTIRSTSMANAVIVGALNDRLLLANPTDISPKQKKKIEIKSCLVGLLEPLLIGFATMQQYFEQKLDLPETLYQITSRFDSLRITPRSLDILARGSPVCGDLAVSLSQAGPQFTQVLRGIYAIKALRFSTALSVLKDEFLRSRDYPQCPPTSNLFHRFRQLGYACVKYGQFDTAKETFEVISDYESMLDLFLCHLNPSAMRRLAQKLEEDGADPELRRYCERILRVRSTGWTQGIFANFAAESMVPKGPEWGGGNWDIKTPTNIKDIPQWELAGEVTPYMKTDDGPIPAIVADHIGVYLGAMKGRGNVVEVREDSLVKAITSGGNAMKSTSLANAMLANSKGALDTTSNGQSLMGLEALMKQPPPAAAGSATEDEQAKAEQEFKKSLYGTSSTGDSSSDEEEGASKTKKFQIRIRDKPTSSTTVDVNKIKEATRQFSLGPPISRTKSLTSPPQDIGLMLPQTAPPATGVVPIPSASASTSANLFGDPFGQPPPLSRTSPTVVGAGVTAGPIPEDFFQNTISSLQVAASLPPAGILISKLDQNAQGLGGNQGAPGQATQQPVAQMNPVADIGLPDGGVPPQASQQPVAQMNAGVSLQPAAFPSQPHVQTAQVPAQPLDLSSLEGPGSRNAEKPATQPTSVRPGQVPRGAAAPVCFKVGLAHLEQNQLSDALSCFDESFLALAKDQSRGSDIKAQATICAQYKVAVMLLQEIGRLQKVMGPAAISAKDEMARLSRHLGSLPLLAKHRISCIRTAIKRNIEVQNYAYAKQMLDLLLSKAPPSKQEELRSLIELCLQRGLTNKSIDPMEDPSQFCAATLSRLSTIGYDVCDLCGVKFTALAAPGCIVCGVGSIKRSDALSGPAPTPTPFG